MSEKSIYMLGRNMIDLYAGLRFNLDVVRLSSLPSGPKIVAANHPTTTDPVLVMILTEEQTSILISETLFKVPVLGMYLRSAGHIPVLHSNGQPSFEEARRLLEQGRTVAIFPEGAISPIWGGVHPPHTGVARLALSTGAPVIPVGIGLDRERIRRVETTVDGKKEVATWYTSGPYAMTVGKPMYFTGDLEDRAYVRQLSHRIMERIAQLAGTSSNRVVAYQPHRHRSLVGSLLAGAGRLGA